MGHVYLKTQLGDWWCPGAFQRACSNQWMEGWIDRSVVSLLRSGSELIWGPARAVGWRRTLSRKWLTMTWGGRWGVSDAGKGGEGQAGCWCVILTTRPSPPSADTPEACVAQRGGAGTTGAGWEPSAQAGGSFGALDPRLCGQWCLCILAYVQLSPSPTVSRAPHTSLCGPPTVLPTGSLQSSSATLDRPSFAGSCVAHTRASL